MSRLEKHPSAVATAGQLEVAELTADEAARGDRRWLKNMAAQIGGFLARTYTYLGQMGQPLVSAGAKRLRTSVCGRIETSAMYRLFARFHAYIARERSALALAAGCMLGVAVMEVLRPWPLKLVFDGLIMPAAPKDGLTLWFTQMLGRGDVLLGVACLAILLIAIVGGIFAYGQTVLLAGAGRRVVTAIRLDLYRHIQCLSQSFHDNASAGDLLTRLTGDVRLLRDLLVTSGIFMVGRALVLAGSITVMALMDWQLTAVAVVVLPVLTWSTVVFSRRIKRAARRQRKTESRATHIMSENLESIRIIQAHAREDHEAARFNRENLTSAEGELVTTRLEASMDRTVEVLLALGTCGVLWFGVSRVRADVLSPGDLLVFTAYLAGMYKPVRKLASLTGRLAKATACGERVLSLLDRSPDIRDRPDAIDGERIKGAVAFDAVNFGYGSDADVLRQASFSIAPGETVAFFSPSGSGKSTIAHLLLRFYEPRSGTIRIDGRDIRDYRLATLRENVTVLLQEAALFNASIRENIAYGKPDATDEEIVRAAQAACAHDFISGMREGYDTIVGRRGVTLSGGQRQRITIARAMIRKTPIVILDEPGTGLDSANEKAVLAALRALSAGCTCIIITHDADVAALADRSFDISNGTVAERQAPRKSGQWRGAE